MAENVTIGGNGSLFVGEDKTIILEVILQGSTTVSVDMTGWTLLFDVRKTDNAADPAIISHVPTLTGTFNALRSSNTQRASVALSDDDMNLFRAGTYRWSWKRMDNGSETVLAWGNFTPQKATAP